MIQVESRQEYGRWMRRCKEIMKKERVKATSKEVKESLRWEHSLHLLARQGSGASRPRSPPP